MIWGMSCIALHCLSCCRAALIKAQLCVYVTFIFFAHIKWIKLRLQINFSRLPFFLENLSLSLSHSVCALSITNWNVRPRNAMRRATGLRWLRGGKSNVTTWRMRNDRFMWVCARQRTNWCATTWRMRIIWIVYLIMYIKRCCCGFHAPSQPQLVTPIVNNLQRFWSNFCVEIDLRQQHRCAIHTDTVYTYIVCVYVIFIEKYILELGSTPSCANNRK